MRPILPSVLDLLLPGVGHLASGRRRVGILLLAPPLLLVIAVAGVLLTGGAIGLREVAVTPGILPALAIINVALAVWRLAASADMARLARPSRAAGFGLGIAALVLVLVPHVVVGHYLASVNDYLDSMFATSPDGTSEPIATDPITAAATEAPTAEADTPDVTSSADPAASSSAAPSPSDGSPKPAPTPRPPMGSGTGTLPGLNVAVPWARPGATPWGDDGRFDLLLLGSDAGSDRWSRRMDTMLLVEIDVATGKTAMIGLPRNLVNAPFPPGRARDAVTCGCFTNLLNALYVEATVTHPSRWPGTGEARGIGAVRAVVSELTGRPIDAVLVADLWGVIKVVDAMGGIEINVPAAVHDDRYPDPVYGPIVLDIPRGRQTMDGRTALAYARSRHQDSDYGRMARQQTLLLAIRAQLGVGTILKAPSLLKAATGFAWTDLPRSSLPNLVDLFGRAATASVRQLRIVPSRYPAVLTPKVIHQIQVDIAALLGTVPPPTPSPSATPSTSPSATPSPSPSPSESPSESLAPTPAITEQPSAEPSAEPTPSLAASSPPP